jgi:hypothetical protein
MGLVTVNFTNGLGNNLFQYVVGRLISEYRDCGLECMFLPNDQYGPKAFQDLRLGVAREGERDGVITVTVEDGGVSMEDAIAWTDRDLDVKVQGHFEDYTIFRDYLDVIRSWFHPVDNVHQDDLVLHLRLGDRLVYRSSYEPGMCVTSEKYIQTITEHFDFERLHIVTDLPEWRAMSASEIAGLTYHIPVGDHMRADPSLSAKYLRSLVENLNKAFHPTVQCGGYMGAAQDFDYLRRFGQIIFQHGTMAWWAAVISNPDKVGVYGPWRPAKGDRNKNLGQTDYPGWFSWE